MYCVPQEPELFLRERGKVKTGAGLLSGTTELLEKSC